MYCCKLRSLKISGINGVKYFTKIFSFEDITNALKTLTWCCCKIALSCFVVNKGKAPPPKKKRKKKRRRRRRRRRKKRRTTHFPSNTLSDVSIVIPQFCGIKYALFKIKSQAQMCLSRFGRLMRSYLWVNGRVDANSCSSQHSAGDGLEKILEMSAIATLGSGYDKRWPEHVVRSQSPKLSCLKSQDKCQLEDQLFHAQPLRPKSYPTAPSTFGSLFSLILGKALKQARIPQNILICFKLFQQEFVCSPPE